MSKETITVEVTSEVALAYLSAPAEQQSRQRYDSVKGILSMVKTCRFIAWFLGSQSFVRVFHRSVYQTQIDMFIVVVQYNVLLSGDMI